MAEAPTVEEETLGPDDAVDVLEELLPAQNKSYELGLKLKLPQHVVEAIHSKELPPDKYLLKVLIKFLQQTDPKPTWRVIVEALKSSVVNLPALAQKVEAAHCPDSISTATETEANTATSGDQVKSKTSSLQSPVTTQQKSVTQVCCEIKSFRQRFDSMKESTIECLMKFNIAVLTVAYVLTSIKALDEHELFLRDNHEKIHSCRHHWELFGWLNFYWNYLAFDLLYQLLDVLTRKESSFSFLLQEMETYKRDMEQFRRSTTLELFCLAEPHREADPPPDFRKMVVKHNWPNTVMLEDVELFRESLQETYNLKKCALMVKSVKRGSFIVTWFVHTSAVAILRKGGVVKLMEQFQITRLEIDGNSVCPQAPVQTYLGPQGMVLLSAPSMNETLVIEDLREVRSQLMEVEVKWRDIGLELGITYPQLQKIKTENNNHVTGCLMAMLIDWLNRSYDTSRYGEPSWQRLSEAVGKKAGGDNPRLANRILQHTVT